MFATITTESAGNTGKLDAVREILHPFQRTMGRMVENLDRRFQQGDNLPRFSPWKPKDLDSSLSGRQFQTAYSQVLGQMKAFYSILENRVRDLITYSSLDDLTRTELYRINRRHAWYVPSLDLDWDVDTATGELVYAAYGKGSVRVPVSDNTLKTARRLIKQARRHEGRPNLLHTRTLRLDAKVMEVEETTSSPKFNHWLRLSTMRKGKRVVIPILENPYSRKDHGAEKKVIQLGIFDDHITIGRVYEHKDAAIKADGASLGLDWGVSSLFTTSDGRMLGGAMLHRLRELDELLIERTKALQKDGTPFKKDAKWVSLNRRITEYVKNEVGRILNRLAAEDIRELVLEKLDFRGGGLSHRMNRIVSRAGRGAVSAKLERLREKQGIISTEVNPAYTSQMCSSCGFVDKKSRKDQSHFSCRCCGRSLNADVNAARNILGRRSAHGGGSALASQRRSLLEYLLFEHSSKCPTGKHSSDRGLVGLTGGIISPRAPAVYQSNI